MNDDQVVAMVGNTSFVECAANAQLYEDENVIVIAGVGVPVSAFIQLTSPGQLEAPG